MLKPQRVTFDELSQRLRQFKQRHGYSTIEFYRRYEHTIVRRFSSSCVWCLVYRVPRTSPNFPELPRTCPIYPCRRTGA